jgi:hypothetical protein
MGIENRLRRLEQEAHAASDSCPQCNGLIIYEEIAEDGTVSYPHGEPCPACDSRGSGRKIGRIVIDQRRPEGGTERDPSRGMGGVYEIVEDLSES